MADPWQVASTSYSLSGSKLVRQGDQNAENQAEHQQNHHEVLDRTLQDAGRCFITAGVVYKADRNRQWQQMPGDVRLGEGRQHH